MRRTAWVVGLAVSLWMLVPTGGTGAQASTPPPPNDMTSIGDSITRANDACCWYGDHPGHSWSTGGTSGDGVRSHYERILAVNPGISGDNRNAAVSGSKMSAGPAQAKSAVAQGAEYVTILLGANDLCTSAPSTMTSVDTYRSEFRQTLKTLMTGLPGRARVFVSSIPDVYQLWATYHTDSTARAVWNTADICQSLLASTRTEDGRQRVRHRNIAFNDVLRLECAQYARCRFDGNAVFDYQFAKSEISKLDYFHPDLDGQASLARITWARSWWA